MPGEIKSLEEWTEKEPGRGEQNGHLEGHHSTFLNVIIFIPQGKIRAIASQMLPDLQHIYILAVVG